MLLPSETQRASVFEGMAMPMVPLVLVALLSQALTASPNSIAPAILMIVCIMTSFFCCRHFSGCRSPSDSVDRAGRGVRLRDCVKLFNGLG
ncbi:hypothetical protein D9M71_782960 [compost metagenome]